jgi:hypothetical protein
VKSQTIPMSVDEFHTVPWKLGAMPFSVLGVDLSE